MTTAFTSEHLRKTLVFPFKDEKWFTKFIVFFAVALANFIIPIVPSIFICGYLFRIMKPIIKEGTEPKLPEWNDWGGLFKDGFRLFAVNFIYTFPAAVVGIFGTLVYFSYFLLIPLSESGTVSEGLIVSLMFLVLGIFFLSILFCMIWMMLVLIVLPPAMGHVVAKDSFGAAFQFSGWWKVFRANLGGYFVAAVIFLGLYMVIMFASYIFYMTLILICLMYVVALFGGLYLGVVSSALWGQVYREGIERTVVVKPLNP